ncbi:MAG TPA: hypothetical protein VGN64_01310 [Dyadobacter sp.]|jgi:hypothetical protein|nr:hypothetical protein [Dyadobacter sp.]
MNADQIDILGEQGETLGTADDLTEEIILNPQLEEQEGARIRIEFETSRGLCIGHYTVSDNGHEEITMEPDSLVTLTSLYPVYFGTYMHPLNRDWVEIDISETHVGNPEYKLYNRFRDVL